jgi:hypothetical protein
MEPSSKPSYFGHIRNGVIVFDAQVFLNEGQPVRVEPLGQDGDSNLDHEAADRVRKLQMLFTTWTEEDGKLSNEEADRLGKALERSRGLEFRPPTLD